MLKQTILQAVLILFCALFTAAESSFTEINDHRLEKLAASGSRRALKVKKINDDPKQFLSSVRTAVTLIGFTSSAAGTYCFSGRISELLKKAVPSLSAELLAVISTAAVILVLAFLMAVFGQFIPRRAAKKEPEKNAVRLVSFVPAAALLFSPFTKLVRICSRGLLKIVGFDPDASDDSVTEEEILMMSDAGAETGAIDEDENRIIKNVFAFDDLTAGQICTHRTDVSVLWAEDDPAVWEETIHRTRHSAFPVCGESVDNVTGILNAKDYFRLEDKSRASVMNNAVREPFFVHENMKADRLFAYMKKKGADHFAVVVDEYGGMSGILTVTDLVEKLVGDFDDDEDDQPQELIEELGGGEWNIPGTAPVSDVCETIGIDIPDDKYDTFGSYVISLLDEVPKSGDNAEIQTDSLIIRINGIDHHRIVSCRVKLIQKSGDDEQSEEE